MKPLVAIKYLLALPIAVLLLQGCDTGLQPPPPSPPFGSIQGTVQYEGTWPPPDSLHDLRFVAFREIPRDTADFTDLRNLVYSNQLSMNVAADTFMVGQVPNDVFRYCVIAQQYGPNVFTDWRPVGIYTENNGVLVVEGKRVEISIKVNFNNLPPFPPN